MQCMNRENVLNLRSFWQIQIVGWCCFYLFNLLESIHNFLTQRVSIGTDGAYFLHVPGKLRAASFLPPTAATVAVMDRF